MGSWHYSLEGFSAEYRKTKTNRITLANHNWDINNTVNQSNLELHIVDGKLSAHLARLVSVLLLIG